MNKKNNFYVDEIDDDEITIKETDKKYSPFLLFFKRYGFLLFSIMFLIALMITIGALCYVFLNIKESKIVKYEENGVVVSFNGNNKNVINGTPITNSYAKMLFDNVNNTNDSENGVVIKVKEVIIYDRVITFFSDNTAIIKYNNGDYLRIFAVDNNYGVDSEGTINKKAKTIKVSGVNSKNGNIDIISFSDGSMLVTVGKNTFFSRNSNIINNSNYLYTLVSGVSVPIREDSGNIYYSDDTIRKDDYIIVNNNKYYKKDEKTIFDDIKIIYYSNNYAVIIKDNVSFMVKNSSHIVYKDNFLEIVDTNLKKEDIKDLIGLKELELNNNNDFDTHFIIVLEESDNIKKRIDNNLIYYNVKVGNNTKYNNKLNNNIYNNKDYGLTFSNNSYLLCEGDIKKRSKENVKLAMWASYEEITNEYMNSSFIGTIKVYIETINK